MKFLAHVLTLFLAGLSFAPCADDAETDSLEISCQLTESDHNHRHTADLCSPFCVCHCCHSHSIVQHSCIIEPKGFTYPPQGNPYLERLPLEVITALLQPPQV